MNLCIRCPMIFDPEHAGQPATDDRGGVFSGWSLPAGVPRPPAHEHELATCARSVCDENADAEDGQFCSAYCRNRDVVECGE